MTGPHPDGPPGEVRGPIRDESPGGAVNVPRTDPDELLTGRELRRLTARAAAARADAGPGEIVVDVAYAVVSVALATGWVIGLASMLRSTLDPGSGSAAGGPPVLGPGAVQALGTAALLAFLTGTAVRLGPVGAGSAGVRWWVPSPADRRGLVSPSFVRAVLLGGVLGAVGTVAVSVAAGLDAAPALRAALTGGALGLLLVSVAGLVQPSPRAASALARASDVAVAAVPVAGLVLVVAGRSGLPALAAPPLVAVGLLAVAAALVLRWWRGLESLGATVLRAQSSVADQVGGAVLSFDTRDLGRALRRAGAARVRVRRPRRFAAVRGASGAVVAADLVLLGRSPSALAQARRPRCADRRRAAGPRPRLRVRPLRGAGRGRSRRRRARCRGRTHRGDGARRRRARPARRALDPARAHRRAHAHRRRVPPRGVRAACRRDGRRALGRRGRAHRRRAGRGRRAQRLP